MQLDPFKSMEVGGLDGVGAIEALKCGTITHNIIVSKVFFHGTYRLLHLSELLQCYFLFS